MTTLEVGQELPAWSLPMTPTTIVSTAIATRDWQDVHHDRDIAQAAGSKDIFMNILTSNGLVERFVVDTLGPDTELKAPVDLSARVYARHVDSSGEVQAMGPWALFDRGVPLAEHTDRTRSKWSCIPCPEQLRASSPRDLGLFIR